MKKLIIAFLVLPIFLGSATKVFAQTNSYFRGVVVAIENEGVKKEFGHDIYFQDLKVKLSEGVEKNKVISLQNSTDKKLADQKKLNKSDQVILLASTNKDKTTYSVWDKYRLTPLIYILVLFFIMVVVFAGLKGVGSILGMGVSLATILLFIVPQILNGRDPLLITILGSLIIMVISIYLAHGFSKKTSIAVVSTFLSLVITGVLAYIFVALTRLSGSGSEENYLLQVGPNSINVKGLLLGGIIIGTLGVLDDITTSLSTAIEELTKAGSKLSFTDLIYRGYKIGREHIASLVNTLVLAYAGASLGIFILFVLNPTNTPYWVILNSEIISEEIVRTLAGSIGLLLAVPITTVLSAWFFAKSRNKA